LLLVPLVPLALLVSWESNLSPKQNFAVCIVRRSGEAQIKSGLRVEGGWFFLKALQAAIPSSVKTGSGRYWFFSVGGSWCWPWPWRIRWMRAGGMVFFSRCVFL
jgi:hypothetical protein